MEECRILGQHPWDANIAAHRNTDRRDNEVASTDLDNASLCAHGTVTSRETETSKGEQVQTVMNALSVKLKPNPNPKPSVYQRVILSTVLTLILTLHLFPCPCEFDLNLHLHIKLQLDQHYEHR